MLFWKDDYLIGVPEIDEQHKKLFEIANRAYELVQNKFYTDKYDKIVEIIQELKDYTVFHFKAEEEYMSSIKYKRLLSQKVYHAEFIEKINNIDLTKVDENQDKHIMDILEFVVRWIDEHILLQDKMIVLG